MLAYFAYLQAVLGPVMPFLRDEMDLSYTVGGLHFSALALGMVLAGLTGDYLLQRWGRQVIFWAGGGGMALGAIVVALGRHPALTILGAGVMGFLGTLLMTTIQSALADRHGPNRAIALTESNVAASLAAGLLPLLVGGFERIGLGWRAGLYVAALVWALALFGLRHEPVPAAPPPEDPIATESPGRKRHTLPGLFWAYWVVLVLGVAVEWSVVSWGADFLVNVRAMRKADASLIMTLFFLAMVTGRASGSRLTRLMDTSRLMLAVLGVSTVGLLLFVLPPLPALSVIGLFVAGLGISNLFPFMLSIAVSTAAAHSDRASARVALGAGLAILLAPQTLGWTADQTDIQAAYGLVFGLLGLAAAVTVFANRKR